MIAHCTPICVYLSTNGDFIKSYGPHVVREGLVEDNLFIIDLPNSLVNTFVKWNQKLVLSINHPVRVPEDEGAREEQKKR